MNAHHLVRPGATHGGGIINKIQETQKPQLVDDRPRFRNVGDGPVFFPANPEWFHLGSYNGWAHPPLGAFGDGGGTNENLRLPRDLVCLQHTGFDNTYEMTGHKLPGKDPIVFRRQQGTHVGDTYEKVSYGSVPLWTNPPVVIQIQLEETANRDQRPHPKPNQGRLREHPRPDDRYNDKEHLNRWIRREEETTTGDTGPRDPQGKRGTRREGSPHSNSEEDLRNAALRSWNPKGTKGTQREESPHSSGKEDLRNVIERLGARRRPGRYKTKSQATGQSIQERCESRSRGTDPNEHRTRRHKYDTDFPLDREHGMAPYEQRGDDKTHKRMLRWLSEDPTRFADAQRDVAEWKEYLAKKVKNPVFPLFVSMAYGNRDLQGSRSRDLRGVRWSKNLVIRHGTAVRRYPP